MKKYAVLIMLISWMGLIFYFSSQSGSDSSSLSSYFVEKLVFLFSFFENYVVLLEFIIRKFAHLFMYFVLALLTFNFVINYQIYKLDKKKQIMFVLLFCLCYALFDEMNQLFTLGREGSIFDVLIDSLGIVIGVYFFRRIYEKSI